MMKKQTFFMRPSQLWVDAIIQPEETRSWISMGIEIANNTPSQDKFNMGVLQV